MGPHGSGTLTLQHAGTCANPMNEDSGRIGLAEALTALTKTKAVLEGIPPHFVVATGHEDEVLLFLVRVRDVDATVSILSPVIKISETNQIVKTLAATDGLLKKRFPIDEAKRLREELEAVGTNVEFLRPDEVWD